MTFKRIIACDFQRCEVEAPMRQVAPPYGEGPTGEVYPNGWADYMLRVQVVDDAGKASVEKTTLLLCPLHARLAGMTIAGKGS